MTRHSYRFLSADHIYRDLTFVLGIFFISGPVLEALFHSSRIDTLLTTGLLTFALFEITRRPADLVIGLALGIPAAIAGVVNAATPDTPSFNFGPTVLAGLFIGFLIQRILKDVLTGSRISSEQIFGAVCAYLLIGILFSTIYGFIVLVDPGAFAVTDNLAQRLADDARPRGSGVFTYFSFVTMSTLGYGDIAPVSPAARSVAWLQAVVGQLYLAITVAALVGTHIARKNS
jgi:voltage-gated potassium channel